MVRERVPSHQLAWPAPLAWVSGQESSREFRNMRNSVRQGSPTATVVVPCARTIHPSVSYPQSKNTQENQRNTQNSEKENEARNKQVRRVVEKDTRVDQEDAGDRESFPKPQRGLLVSRKPISLVSNRCVPWGRYQATRLLPNGHVGGKITRFTPGCNTSIHSFGN